MNVSLAKCCKIVPFMSSAVYLVINILFFVPVIETILLIRVRNISYLSFRENTIIMGCKKNRNGTGNVTWI